ncbi:two-component regulator propeller domain-containing protein [Terrimonas rubra]|uniref:Two-component regulator propeller domain-containing protein n=1 Tax=Terrimonas rubra TaxID=1035890 RepID=A0ABW5ZYU3_9BACT
MNKNLKLIYFLLILIINFSCIENRSAEKETGMPGLAATLSADTLKFTSGIRAILQDSKGNYWFGSQNEGAGFYNGKTFKYFTTKEGLADNQIRSIQEDREGVIWFDTQNGVSSYDGKTIKNHTVNENAENEWKKTDFDLWFSAGTKQGVNKYDGQKLNYLAFPDPVTVPGGNTYAVTSFSKGKHNMQWIGTYAGVFGYNGSNMTILNNKTLGINNEQDGLHIRSTLEDSKGRLWIGNNGIGVLLKNGDAIIHFSKELGKSIPINELEANTQSRGFNKNKGLQAVFAIEEDSDGNIWFGDRDSGAWKYDGKTMTNYTISHKLSQPMIWTIYKDNNNNLLFGMAGGGVYQFNGNSFDRQF